MSKKIKTGFLCILLMTLVACGKKEKTDQNDEQQYDASSILLHADGTVTENIIEHFDEEEYDVNALQLMIDTQVADYNASFPEGAKGEAEELDETDEPVPVVACIFFSVESNVALVTMEYSSVEHFRNFNCADIFVGSVEEAITKGYDISENTDYATGKAVADDVILENKDKKICIIGFPYSIEVEGKVLFYGKTMISEGSNRVAVKDGNSGYVIYE